MGVLKKITDEYFGDVTREEDMDIDGIIKNLPVDIVVFTDMNGDRHSRGFMVREMKDGDDMVRTLRTLISRIVEKRGNECSLNDIDVSNMPRMRTWGSPCYGVFEDSDFDGDISGWDVSKIKDFKRMFYNSKFSGKNGIFDLDKGNAAEEMSSMFAGSKINGAYICGWFVDEYAVVKNMFRNSPVEGYEPGWWKRCWNRN